MSVSGSFGNHISGYDVSGFSSLAFFTETAVSDKLLMLSTSIFDKAIVEASSEIGTLVAANTQNQEPTKVWRSASAVNQHLKVTLHRPEVLNCAAFTFWQGGLSDAAVWRVKIYATEDDMLDDVDAVVDTDWESVWPQDYVHNSEDWGPEVALLRWDNDVAYRHARILFSDPGVGAVYLDIGRVGLGKSIQFQLNPKHDGGVGFVSIDVQEANGYGQIFTDPRPYQQRQFDLVWSALGDREMKEDASELTRLRGQAGDLYVFLNPGARTDFHLKSMQCLFGSSHKFTPLPSYVQDKDGVGRNGWSFSATLLQKL